MPRMSLQKVILWIRKNGFFTIRVLIFMVIGFIILLSLVGFIHLEGILPILILIEIALLAYNILVDLYDKSHKKPELNNFHKNEMIEKNIIVAGLDNSAIMNILVDSTKAKFTPLKRDTPKSPLELIKQIPQEDNVLPLLANMTKFESIDMQIKYARHENWINVYSDSWAEREVQLIGFHLLEEIERRIDRFSDMYDAGCANFGQFKALMALKKRNNNKVDTEFKYFAQDFIPEWKQKFHIDNGNFFPVPLPLVNLNQNLVTLVSCTHTLHFMEKFPIAIYSSIFSFNKLLKKDGYCYITVPEKDNQPGMLDLLEKAANDAGFSKVESGKKRLVHKLKEEPFNVTTFLYLIIQKQEEIDDNKWKDILKASFFRAEYYAPEQFRINNEKEINSDIIILEEYLNEIFNERTPFLRTFLYALDTINDGRKGKIPDAEMCRIKIKSMIKELHELITDTKESNQKADMQLKCVCYYYWLVGFYINKGTKLKEIVDSIYPIVKQVFNSSEDIRVHIDNLNNKQNARLLKHLFEFCQYENIEIREAFEKDDFLKYL